MKLLSDTSPEAERVLTEVYRRMTPDEKWLLLGRIYHTAKMFHEAGVRWRNPTASHQEVLQSWMVATLGKDLTEKVLNAAHGHKR